MEWARDAIAAIATKGPRQARVAAAIGPDRGHAQVRARGTAAITARKPIRGRTRAKTGTARDTASGRAGCAGGHADGLEGFNFWAL